MAQWGYIANINELFPKINIDEYIQENSNSIGDLISKKYIDAKGYELVFRSRKTKNKQTTLIVDDWGDISTMVIEYV